MREQTPGGFQIAFLLFAFLLLLVPVANLVESWFPPGDVRALVERTLPVVATFVLLAVVPVTRRAALALLAPRIPRERYAEVAAICLVALAHTFAFAALWALWWDFVEGPVALEQRVRALGGHEAALAQSFSAPQLVQFFVVGAVIAPIAEEVLFRGFLYRAWARRFHWSIAMLLTSIVFGMYHANFVPSFLASVLWVCLYRRTGSLWAPILSHMLSNISVHYALLGQLVFPRTASAPGDLAEWKLQVFCLLFLAIVMPLYAWMSRSGNARVADLDEAHVAVSR